MKKDFPAASDAGRTPRSARGGSREDDIAPVTPEPLPGTLQADDIAPATPRPLPGTPQAVDVPVEEDDIPVGYAEDILDPAVDDDASMEDGIAPLIHDASDSDVGLAGPYDNDTDSDSDAGKDEPPIKRARGLHAIGALGPKRDDEHHLGVVGVIDILPDETAVETPGQQTVRQKAKEELRSLMATAEVKRILRELEEQSELQLPKQWKKQPRLGVDGSRTARKSTRLPESQKWLVG